MGEQISEKFIQYTTNQYKQKSVKKNSGFSRLGTFTETETITMIYNGMSFKDFLLQNDATKILTLVMEKNVKQKFRGKSNFSHLESVYQFLNHKHHPKKKKIPKSASQAKLQVGSLNMKDYSFKMKTMVECHQKNEVKLLANRPKSIIGTVKKSFPNPDHNHD